MKASNGGIKNGNFKILTLTSISCHERQTVTLKVQFRSVYLVKGLELLQVFLLFLKRCRTTVQIESLKNMFRNYGKKILKKVLRFFLKVQTFFGEYVLKRQLFLK